MNKDDNINRFDSIKQILNITILSFIIIFCIVSSFYALCMIDKKEFESWLGFSGSIIGGLLTLGGVAWTINNDRKIRIENKTLEYMPIIYPTNLQFHQYPNNTKKIRLLFYLKNVGRGESHNIKMSCFQSNDSEVACHFVDYEGKDVVDIPLLPVNEHTQIEVICDLKQKINEMIPIEINFCLSYLGYNKQKINTEFSVKITLGEFYKKNIFGRNTNKTENRIYAFIKDYEILDT